MDIFKTAILLKGYTQRNPDRIYDTAKEPTVSGFTKADYTPPTPEQIVTWQAKDGWIGHLVPAGHHVIDVEDPHKIRMIRDLLRRKGLEPPINHTNNGLQFVFSTNGGHPLTGDSGRACRLGFEVTDRAAGKNYVILPPTNGRTWENEKASIPTIPDELLPPENTIGDTLKVLAWSLGAAHREGILAGYDDIDGGFMSLLVTCEIPEADILEAYRLAFLTNFDERRTLTMLERTKARKAAGEPLTGTASLIQSLKDKELKSIVATIRKLERLAGKAAETSGEDEKKNGNRRPTSSSRWLWAILNFSTTRTSKPTRQFNGTNTVKLSRSVARHSGLACREGSGLNTVKASVDRSSRMHSERSKATQFMGGRVDPYM